MYKGIEENDDDDIDAEKTLEKTYKESERSFANAQFIEGVNKVKHD